MTYFSWLLLFTGSLLAASSPPYQEHPHQKIQGDGGYVIYAPLIDASKIKTIFEIGSRDARDAIELSDLYKCHVFAFECNPSALEICKKNIGSNPNITLVPMGVFDATGELDFYRVIDGNIGASSFFPFSPQAINYQAILEEGLIQEKISVPTTRLDDFLHSQNIENIDLLCMDVQGAAFQVIKSLGSELSKVKYIITELEMNPIYTGEVLFPEVDQYLKEAGFVRISRPLEKNELFGDVLYRNKQLKRRSH